MLFCEMVGGGKNGCWGDGGIGGLFEGGNEGN